MKNLAKFQKLLKHIHNQIRSEDHQNIQTLQAAPIKTSKEEAYKQTHTREQTAEQNQSLRQKHKHLPNPRKNDYFASKLLICTPFTMVLIENCLDLTQRKVVIFALTGSKVALNLLHVITLVQEHRLWNICWFIKLSVVLRIV